MKIVLWVSQDIKMAYLPNMSGETLATLAQRCCKQENFAISSWKEIILVNIHAMVLASLSDESAIVKLRQG